MGAALRRTIPTIAASGVAVLVVAATAVAAATFARAGETPAPATSPSTSTPADGLQYLPIEEPFTLPVGRCDQDGSSIEMANCFLEKVARTDHTINLLQKRLFGSAATTGQRRERLGDDAAWLKQRAAAVAAISTGGTIDGVLKAQEMLEFSQKRLNVLQR